MSEMMSSKEVGIIGARSRLRWMGKSVCGQGVDGIFVCAVYPPACEFSGSIECGLLPHITVAPKGNHVPSFPVCVASCSLPLPLPLPLQPSIFTGRVFPSYRITQ